MYDLRDLSGYISIGSTVLKEYFRRIWRRNEWDDKDLTEALKSPEIDEKLYEILRAAMDDAYDTGRRDGYQDGAQDGYQDGYQSGYDKGREPQQEDVKDPAERHKWLHKYDEYLMDIAHKPEKEAQEGSVTAEDIEIWKEIEKTDEAYT